MAYHPINQFIFYGAVLWLSMFYRHPVLLCISAAGAAAYSAWLNGRGGVRYGLLMLPVCLLAAVVNPLFSHKGMTILGYFSNGNPITLESILYGAVSGVMLAAVLLWFYSLHEVMTSDKWIYLFGRLLPSLSLLISMVFGLIPKYRRQIKRISDAQKGIGRAIGNGTLRERISHGMSIMSIMATWAFEHSVETADSMKSRGYGLRGRTSYAIYRFGSRDGILLVTELTCILLVTAGATLGIIRVEYYPLFSMGEMSVWTMLLYVLYGIFCFLPIFVDMAEDMRWHYIRSKI